MDVRTEAKLAMANTEHILQDAQLWMGSFIEADCKKNSVIQQLIERLDENQYEMEQLRRDLAAERKTRNTFQMESDRYESEMLRLEQRVVSFLPSMPGVLSPLPPLYHGPSASVPPVRRVFYSYTLAAHTVRRMRVPLSPFL